MIASSENQNSEAVLLKKLTLFKTEMSMNPLMMKTANWKHVKMFMKLVKNKSRKVQQDALTILKVIVEQSENPEVLEAFASENSLCSLNMVLLRFFESDRPDGNVILTLAILCEVIAKHDNFPYEMFQTIGCLYAVSSIFFRYSDAILEKCFQDKWPSDERKNIIYSWRNAIVCLAKFQNFIQTSPLSSSTSSWDSVVNRKVFELLEALASGNIPFVGSDLDGFKTYLMYYLVKALGSKTYSDEFCEQQGLSYLSQLLRIKIRMQNSDDSEAFDSITETLMVIHKVVKNGSGDSTFWSGLVKLIVALLKTFDVALISQTFDPTVSHSVLICVCEILTMLFQLDKSCLDEFVTLTGIDILTHFRQSCYPASVVIEHILALFKDDTPQIDEEQCNNIVKEDLTGDDPEVAITINDDGSNTDDDEGSEQVIECSP